jgi:valyl-tRNA synthetase
MALEYDELGTAIGSRLAGMTSASSGVSPAAPSTTPEAAPKQDAKAKKDKGEKGEKAAKPVKDKPQWGAPGSGKAKKEEAKAKYNKVEEEVVVEDTPEGEKKDTSKPINEKYHPKAVESAWSPGGKRKVFSHLTQLPAKTRRRIIDLSW